jgi:protease I
MAHDLRGRKVAILMGPKGTDHSEFVTPKEAVESAGAEVRVIGIEPGEVQTVKSSLEPAGTVRIERAFDDASPDEFDALIIPGGTVGSDKLRGSAEAVAFVRSFAEQGKPIGAICHGPWLLVEADAVRGRPLTSYATLQTDIRNAGGSWVDREVNTDANLVTSRTPDDLPAFCEALVQAIGQGRQARATA